MTLTQLNAFVLVARLGSVTAAANALGVSEPAVSQALSALRLHLGDQLVSRGPGGMTLTAGGSRLLATASQIVVLGAEAHAAVRAAQGAPRAAAGGGHLHDRRVRGQPADGGVHPAVRRLGRGVRRGRGDATRWRCWSPTGWPISRSARPWTSDPALPVVSEPIFRYRLVVVTAGAVQAARQRPPVALAGGPVRHRPGQRHRPAADRAARPGRPDRGVPQPDRRLGARRPTARGWRPRSSTWSPSSCAAASCRWSTCPARRWTPAGTRRCWTASTGARPPARCGASSARPEAMHLMRVTGRRRPAVPVPPPVYVTIWS